MRGIMIVALVAGLGASFALAEAGEDEGYTYTLNVKNRELTTENVDVTVFVDRNFATRETLRFGDVEDIRPIKLKLEPGPHRIRIEALKGTKKIEQEMVVSEAGSADVEIWFEPVMETWPPEAVVQPEPYSTP
jgi:archaellum component FlaG (FlaF/FlaG flagellin family)